MRKKVFTCLIVILSVAALAAAALTATKRREKREAEAMTERADKAMQQFLDKYYVADEDGETGSIPGELFWPRAEIFEIAADAYEKTKDEKYSRLMEQMYRGFVSDQGEDWSGNDFNDDIMWMTIGCARAYLLTGKEIYKQQAVRHFDLVFDRAWSDELGGGLYWKTDNTCKNSCINGPAAIAACLLAQATGDEAYLEKARRIYDWQVSVLFGPDGAVYDAITVEGEINTWCSTYNQGTFIGASVLLYQNGGDKSYLDNAVLAADYCMNTMYEGGVMSNEEEGADLPGFKGILCRWLGKLIYEAGQEQYLPWLQKNADAAWENQNSSGVTWTAWGEKTEDGFHTAWGCSAAPALMWSVAPER